MSKRVVWLTDIHLNFLSDSRVDAFLSDVTSQRPDGVLIGGDIAEAHNVCDYLGRIQAAIECPFYFVLGNHDFYYGSIRATRKRVEELCTEHKRLHYLTLEAADALSEHVGVVGHDGWADGRLGNYPRSLVKMLDWKLIEELEPHDRQSRWEVLKGLADEAAAHLRRVLPAALARFEHVVLLTHVPPFLAACWHEGKISDDQWSPHFTCHAVGAAIVEIMDAHPDRKLTVLCGHTHGQGETSPRANITVLTGGAEYGAPRIARVFDFD
jgi:predicted MPP superfamily phosphohydrolase